MNIITPYPIYVQGRSISKNGGKLKKSSSFDGDEMSFFDASNQSSVIAFQKWYNSTYGYAPTSAFSLNENGTLDTKTNAAINSESAKFDAAMGSPISNSISNSIDTGGVNSVVTANKKQKIADAIKKGLASDTGGILKSGFNNWLAGKVGAQAPSQQLGGPQVSVAPTNQSQAKQQGMSTGMKVGLAVGGGLLLITVIYLVAKKK